MELMAARQTWTDDRMDDLVGRMDDGFAHVHGDIKDVRRELGSARDGLQVEIGSVRDELRAEIGSARNELRVEIDSTRDELRLEIRSSKKELQAEFATLRSETNQQLLALNRRFDLFQATWLAAVLAGLIGFFASRLL